MVRNTMKKYKMKGGVFGSLFRKKREESSPLSEREKKLSIASQTLKPIDIDIDKYYDIIVKYRNTIELFKLTCVHFRTLINDTTLHNLGILFHIGSSEVQYAIPIVYENKKWVISGERKHLPKIMIDGDLSSYTIEIMDTSTTTLDLNCRGEPVFHRIRAPEPNRVPKHTRQPPISILGRMKGILKMTDQTRRAIETHPDLERESMYALDQYDNDICWAFSSARLILKYFKYLMPELNVSTDRSKRNNWMDSIAQYDDFFSFRDIYNRDMDGGYVKYMNVLLIVFLIRYMLHKTIRSADGGATGYNTYTAIAQFIEEVKNRDVEIYIPIPDNISQMSILDALCYNNFNESQQSDISAFFDILSDCVITANTEVKMMLTNELADPSSYIFGNIQTIFKKKLYITYNGYIGTDIEDPTHNFHSMVLGGVRLEKVNETITDLNSGYYILNSWGKQEKHSIDSPPVITYADLKRTNFLSFGYIKESIVPVISTLRMLENTFITIIYIDGDKGGRCAELTEAIHYHKSRHSRGGKTKKLKQNT